MMKIIHRVIENDKQAEYVKFMEIFDYYLLERFIEEKTTDLHFIKFNDKPYSKQLNKLEKEYFSLEKIHIFPYVLISILSFLGITAFLILALALKPNFDYTFWFLVLLLPSILLLVIGVAIFIYKYFSIVKDPVGNKKKQEQILQKIKELKESN